jgi:hypothetical protein
MYRRLDADPKPVKRFASCSAPRQCRIDHECPVGAVDRVDIGMKAFLLLAVASCGSVEAPNHIVDARPGDTACVAETDAAFCARVAKTCEMVSDTDNCGQQRSADCGTCTGTNACIANVCKPPVCGSTFQAAPGSSVTSVLVGRQTALCGASTTGQSILYLQTVQNSTCGNFILTIADEAVAGTLPYVPHALVQAPNLGGLSKAEETLVLSPDGLTIIGAATDGRSFLEAKRSAIGMTDFSLAAAGEFATLNTGIPAAPASLRWPVLSADGLAFYFHVVGATDTTMNGEYEALRTSTAMSFPVGTLMPAAVQPFDGITGMSSDRMTAFVTMGFGTQIMTRTSLSQPFTLSTGGAPPGAAFRVMPIAGCTAIGTCEPGGCQNEAVCTWTSN